VSRYPRSPNRDLDLLDAAQRGQLNCTRDHNLNPTFTAPFALTDADRSTIMRFVLQGTLRYEKTGPHGFGIGQLLPRAHRGAR
jgi:hypothetical protein